MKLEHLNEAALSLQAVISVPFEPRLRIGLMSAEQALRCVRAGAFTAVQGKIAGTLDEDMKQEILETIWEELVEP